MGTSSKRTTQPPNKAVLAPKPKILVNLLSPSSALEQTSGTGMVALDLLPSISGTAAGSACGAGIAADYDADPIVNNPKNASVNFVRNSSGRALSSGRLRHRRTTSKVPIPLPYLQPISSNTSGRNLESRLRKRVTFVQPKRVSRSESTKLPRRELAYLIVDLSSISKTLSKSSGKH